ncbi:hypothetical protein UVI_02032190 [Ustilaginoidea virens]|uniref:Uncharacterized protein n=1 Tax=Ustilaginoidea virens TaxID=1159556 RepID=A0A1B5KUC6_USTVR|nr:hypothetical protein UVI_02032190 [Ustilaginoidea virens]
MSKVATTGWEITFFGWGYYRGLSVYACQALVAPKQAMRKGAIGFIVDAPALLGVPDPDSPQTPNCRMEQAVITVEMRPSICATPIDSDK